MAAKKYSYEQIYLGTTPTGVNSTTLYSVAAGTKVLVKEIHLANNTGADRTFSMLVTKSSVDHYYEVAQVINAGSPYDLLRNLVLTAGDVLKINTDGAVAVFISGMLEDAN